MKELINCPENHSLDLAFLDDRGTGTVFSARAFVHVKSHSGHEFLDCPVITPGCVTLSELKANVRMLRRELDNIERAAERKFAAPVLLRASF